MPGDWLGPEHYPHGQPILQTEAVRGDSGGVGDSLVPTNDGLEKALAMSRDTEKRGYPP